MTGSGRSTPRVEQGEHLGEHLPDPVRARLDQVERPVRTPGWSRRRRGSRMSVLPISMNRPPRGSSRSDASTNSPASEFSTTSTPRSQELAREGEVARGRDAASVGRPARAGRAHLPALGRRVDLGAEVPGELHGRHADAAGGGVDQQPLARPQARQVHQRRSRRSGTPPARPPPRANDQPAGHRRDQPPVGDRDRPERAGEQAEHPVARREVGDVRRRPRATTPGAPRCPCGAAPGYMPSAISTSRKFTPAARTATRTWPGQAVQGVGLGAASGSPACLRRRRRAASAGRPARPARPRPRPGPGAAP